MRFAPNVLLVLSLPAGALGFWLAATVLSALPLPEDVRGVLVLFVPLLVAGLFMVPFVVPFIDRKAKADLAAHRRDVEAATRSGDTPEEPDR